METVFAQLFLLNLYIPTFGMIPVHYCTIYFKMNAMMHWPTDINSKPTINNYCGKIAAVLLIYPIVKKSRHGSVFTACKWNQKYGGLEHETELIFQRLYSGSHRTDYFPFWKCNHTLCIAPLSSQPDRFLGSLRDCDSLCFYPHNPAVSHRGHRGGSGQQENHHGDS